MDTKKIAAIFALLVIALGVAGFAYAHWEKIIYVNGTIKTGTFEVIPSFHLDELVQDKPVATLDWDVDVEENTLNISLDNVYPCLWVIGYIDFENTGTIPVHMVNIETDGNDSLNLVNMGIIEEGDYENYTDYEVYNGTTLIANLYVYYRFPDGTQSDPYQIDPKDTAYIFFALHFKEGLPQNTEFWFWLHFMFWNWNEWPAPIA